MNDGGQFLFALPNSIKRLHSNKLLFYGLLMFVCGVTSVVNGALATGLEAVRNYSMSSYVNTHWITSVFLLAGMATMLAERMRINFFFFCSMCLNCICISTAVGCFIFDCINLNTVLNLKQTSGNKMPYISSTQQRAMIAYGVIDLWTSAGAAFAAVMILLEIRSVSQRYFSNVDHLQARFLLPLGGLLNAIGMIKEALWIAEVIWLKDMGDATEYMFLNYTMDEPVWNMIYVITGALVVCTSSTGSRVLSYCTLALTALSAFPVVQYLWIDYRWLLTVRITEIVTEVPKPQRILQANIALSVLHLLTIFVTCSVLVKKFVKSNLPWSSTKLAIDANVRQTITFVGLLLLLGGVVFLITDIINIVSGTFFRMFYPTEQKLPFFLIPAGLFCFISIRYNEFIPFMGPCIVVMLLLCLQATSFHIASYLYLSHNAYFSDRICDLFFFGKLRCGSAMERTGAVAHFFEAAMAVSVMTLCLYGCFIFCRMSCLITVPLRFPLTDDETRRQKMHQFGAFILALIQLIMGIVVYAITWIQLERDNSDFRSHPLIVIHTIIHRTTLSQFLVIFPLVQLILYKNMHIYPMKALTCICIACVRLTDILIQLDYRNLSYLGVTWVIITSVELVVLIMQFGLMAECAILLDLGLNRLPPLEFTVDDETSTPNPNTDTDNNRFQYISENETNKPPVEDVSDAQKRADDTVENRYTFDSFARHPNEDQFQNTGLSFQSMNTSRI